MWYLKHLQEYVCDVNKCLLRMHTEDVQGVWRIVHDPNGALRIFFGKSGFLLALGSLPAIWSQSILPVILRLISVFSICWERMGLSLSPFKTIRSNVLRSPQFLISHSTLKGCERDSQLGINEICQENSQLHFKYVILLFFSKICVSFWDVSGFLKKELTPLSSC